MRTIQAYFTTTLCLTSTMAVLVMLRASSAAEMNEPALVTSTHVTYGDFGADGEPEEHQYQRVSLAGRVLVAAPDMNDPYFSGTVIYMLADDDSGALGVVLNRVRDHEEPGPVTIWDGGPVGRDRVFVLHDDLGDEASVNIGGVAVAADPAILDELFEQRGRFAKADADQGRNRATARVFVGYAGWGPGQLDNELAHSAWRVTDLSPDLVLSQDRAEIAHRAQVRAGTWSSIVY